MAITVDPQDVLQLASRMLQTAGLTDAQRECVGRLLQHELPRHRDASAAVEAVMRAARRQYQAQDPAYHLPVDLLTDLQDVGLPVLDALDIIVASWRGLEEAQDRHTPTTSDNERNAMHQRSVREIVEALRSSNAARALRAPKLLAFAIRCTWMNMSDWPAEFRPLLLRTGVLMDLGFHDRDIEVIVGTYRSSAALAHVEQVVRSGHLTREEVLAIARGGMLEISEADYGRWYAAMARFRGRVRPQELIETVRRIGLGDAIALHEVTDSTVIAVNADEIRKRHGLPMDTFIDAYRSLCGQHALKFESYVALAEHWTTDVVQCVFVAYPDTKLLLSFVHSGHVATVPRAAAAGVPHALLDRYGATLLRRFRHQPDDELGTIADAFALCRGDAEAADRFLALSKPLRTHAAVRELVEREGPATIGDRILLDLVATVSNDGAPLDLELLRAFVEFSRWPQRRHLVRVYGLARRFREHGRAPHRAIEETLAVYDRLSPRTCRRAIADPAYFRYRVLQRRSLPVAVAREIAALSATDHAPAAPHVPYARLASGTTPGTEAIALDDSGSVLDLRTVHEQLNLRDLVPERADAETVAALILYGLCDLGRCVPFAGHHAIPERHILANVRRRFQPDEVALTRAWRWLVSIGILHAPKKRGGEPAYALNLTSDHAHAAGREVARRTSALLSRFHERLRH